MSGRDSVGVRHVRLCAKLDVWGLPSCMRALLNRTFCLPKRGNPSQLRQIIALRKLFSRKQGVVCKWRMFIASSVPPDERSVYK